jgi:hypothetical protein
MRFENLRVFKHARVSEYYIVKGNQEHYIYLNLNSFDGKWHLGISRTWEIGHGKCGQEMDWVQEIGWLELLVATGTSKKQAEELWNEYYGPKVKS